MEITVKIRTLDKKLVRQLPYIHPSDLSRAAEPVAWFRMKMDGYEEPYILWWWKVDGTEHYAVMRAAQTTYRMGRGDSATDMLLGWNADIRVPWVALL